MFVVQATHGTENEEEERRNDCHIRDIFPVQSVNICSQFSENGVTSNLFKRTHPKCVWVWVRFLPSHTHVWHAFTYSIQMWLTDDKMHGRTLAHTLHVLALFFSGLIWCIFCMLLPHYSFVHSGIHWNSSICSDKKQSQRWRNSIIELNFAFAFAFALHPLALLPNGPMCSSKKCSSPPLHCNRQK